MTLPAGWDAATPWARGTGWPTPPTLDEVPFRAILGDLEIVTARTGAEREPFITLERIRGWWESAPDGTSTTEHWASDGDVPLHERLAPRDVELKGFIIGKTMVDAMHAKERLSRIRRTTLQVPEATGLTRLADVRRLDVQYQDLAPHLATYSLMLRADDPVRYGGGEVVLRNGSNALINRGDVTAYPVLDLTGPLAAELVITHPGGTFRVPQFTGGSRLVDCRNGDVFDGGGNRQYDTTGAWPRVVDGGSTWQVSGLGTGPARVRRSEAWS